MTELRQSTIKRGNSEAAVGEGDEIGSISLSSASEPSQSQTAVELTATATTAAASSLEAEARAGAAPKRIKLEPDKFPPPQAPQQAQHQQHQVVGQASQPIKSEAEARAQARPQQQQAMSAVAAAPLPAPVAATVAVASPSRSKPLPAIVAAPSLKSQPQCADAGTTMSHAQKPAAVPAAVPSASATTTTNGKTQTIATNGFVKMEFESWLERHGSGLPKSMEIRPFDNAGSGVFTNAPIVDRILEIPLSIVLTEDKVEQSAEGRAFDRAILDPVSPRGRFYCFLISQRNNKDSFFGPYLRSLPRQYNTPFYWTEEEVQLLAGTNLANSLRDTTAALLSEFERYFPLLSQQCPQWFAASIQFQDYIWAHCTYTSRGFPPRVGRSSGSLGCLLPLLDMLNHQHLTAIEWETNDTNVVIKHCGSQSICANQQVFNNYGAKSNGEFLLGYGFCVADNFDYDTVLVIVGISREDPLYQQKMEVMQQQGLENECYLNVQLLSTELQQIMRIAVMDQHELRDIQQNQQASLDYINVENELNMMESLERLIQHSLQKIRVLEPPSGDSINTRNAELYREGQRNILQVYLSKLLPEYYTRVSQQHAEEFAPYLE